MQMKRLIVNADDFGLTPGVNRAILELHEAGRLTSATLMASAPATGEAIAMALATPTLGVGCHVVLVDGSSVTPVGQLPNLAGGRDLSRTLGQFLTRIHLASPRAIAAEIELEAFTQISRLRDRGVSPTHIDTHKHTHMFPRVLRPVLRAARRAGIRAVRNPFEPSWSIRATPGAPGVRRIQIQILRRLEPAFRRIVAEEGFVTTDGAVGVLATGSLDQATIDSLLRALPDGVWELVTHPGYHDADLNRVRTRLLTSRQTERTALQSVSVPSEIEPITFANLPFAEDSRT